MKVLIRKQTDGYTILYNPVDDTWPDDDSLDIRARDRCCIFCVVGEMGVALLLGLGAVPLKKPGETMRVELSAEIKKERRKLFMAGTLIVGQCYYADENGVTVLPSHGVFHPIDKQQLAVIETAWEKMWQDVRAQAAVSNEQQVKK